MNDDCKLTLFFLFFEIVFTKTNQPTASGKNGRKQVKNTSKNLFFIDVLMLGKSYHNNHHKHPSSINFGKKWHKVEPIYPIIRLLAVLR